MPLSVQTILNRLSEYEHRGCGTEEEELAFETMLTLLAGETGVRAFDEAFTAPATYLRLFAIISCGLLAGLGLFFITPLGGALMASVALVMLVRFFDWRTVPFTWLGARRICRNLVAERDEDGGAAVTGRQATNQRPLVILAAHLDSAPASFAYRRSQIGRFKASFYSGLAGLAAVPVVLWLGLLWPSLVLWLAVPLAGVVCSFQIVAAWDFWRFGYVPGANDNASGVAAVTAAATHLWAKQRQAEQRQAEQAVGAHAEGGAALAGIDVRLLLTSAEEAGLLGAQVYVQAHADELAARPSFVLNIDTVGRGALHYVARSGLLSVRDYDGPLAHMAHSLKVPPASHTVGDFDTAPFYDAGVPCLTLAAYEEDGTMRDIHTPHDSFDALDHACVDHAARIAEKIVTLIAYTQQAPRSHEVASA